MPYGVHRIYEMERANGSAEIRRADEQANRLASADSSAARALGRSSADRLLARADEAFARAARVLADRPVEAATTRYPAHGHGNGVMLLHSVTAPNAISRCLPVPDRRLWAPSAIEEYGVMTEPMIEARDVAKRFGKTRALSGVTFHVDSGTVLGLLEPNGVGKTTMIRVLATLLRPDAGQDRVAGFDVVTDGQRARSVIGLAGQYAAVDELLTGRENLELVGLWCHLPKREYRHRAQETLERLPPVRPTWAQGSGCRPYPERGHGTRARRRTGIRRRRGPIRRR